MGPSRAQRLTFVDVLKHAATQTAWSLSLPGRSTASDTSRVSRSGDVDFGIAVHWFATWALDMFRRRIPDHRGGVSCARR